MQYRLASLFYLLTICILFGSHLRILVIERYQAVNGVHASHDALVDLLESIEHVLSRLSIYTKIPLTPAMDEIVVKIMSELLSTFALATKELKQGRCCESSLANGLPYSV